MVEKRWIGRLISGEREKVDWKADFWGETTGLCLGAVLLVHIHIRVGDSIDVTQT